MSVGPINRITKAKPTLECAGAHLQRAFGFGNTREFDPFLLFDDFRNERLEDDGTRIRVTCGNVWEAES